MSSPSSKVHRRFTLRHKLMLLMLTTSTTALLVASITLIWSDIRTLDKALLAELEALVDVAGERLKAGAKAEQVIEVISSASTKLSGVAGSSLPEVVSATIYNRRGDVLDWFPKALPAPAHHPGNADANWQDGKSFELVRRIFDWERGQGLVYTIHLKVDRHASSRRKEQYLGSSIIVVLITFFLAWLMSSRLEHLISRPISLLAQTAQRVSTEKDYTLRLAQRRNDELGDLISGFNEMLGEIERRDNELLQARGRLEHRVQERTQALQQEVVVRRRAESNLEQQLSRIRLLNDITRAISEHQDLESIFAIVLSQMLEHLPADFGGVLLHEPAGGHLRLVSCRERDLETAHLRLAVQGWSLPLAGTGWEHPEQGPLVLQGGLENANNPVLAKPTNLGMGSAAVLPLRVEGALLGLLIVARRSPVGFDEGEAKFLQALSEHVALAGHQARLHAALEKAYNELRQTQQAVMQHERLRALGQMASGVAHDINNALSPVSGFAELLLTTEPGLSENARKYLQFIKTASDDIAHIVSRLREFYRSREEEQPLVAVELAKLTREVIDLTRPRWRDLAQRRGVDVQVECDLCEEVPTVIGIESELREALTNLLFNALDAMPKGGVITIRTRPAGQIHRGLEEPKPSHLLLEVADTGVGMDEETRRRCLEPFFSTKGKRGTGLGLAMVYGTMQRHEGGIEVDSEVGRGTTVRLIFPVKDVVTPARDAQGQPAGHLRTLRILFVDDEPLLRELIREILEAEGHTVVTADGGVAGLETFRRLRQQQEPPDVVITDLGMPQLDGRELTRFIKQESSHTPIIMMTGWGNMLRNEEALQVKVDALISKPPKIAELLQALRQVVGARPPAV